jgi:excinuclease ABC subunit C
MSALAEKLKLLPKEPGVYLLKDAQGAILYVGKASSLRNRVRSYFGAARQLDPKTRRLVSEVSDFEYIATPSEREALLVEDTLIKKHKPRYNVRLRDDKRYPYLKLTAEPFPRLEIARRIENDSKRGAQYFGPYTNSYAMREARKVIQQVFRIRTCTLDIRDRPVRRRPCLDHYLGLCDAPCVGAVDQPSYRDLVEGAALFLRGQQEELLPRLQREMHEASQQLEFERAARLRDRVEALQRLFHTQQPVSPAGADRDAIGLYQQDGACSVQIFFLRRGKLVGRERLSIELSREVAGSVDPKEILTACVKQYYTTAELIPKEILLQHEIDEAALLEAWLSERRGGRVRLIVPRRGPKAHLIRMAARNAELALREEQARHLPRSEESECAQGELENILRMNQPSAISNQPSAESELHRIEGFDISNFQGAEPVASMVVFEGGRPKKADYRRFAIRAVRGPDDFAMMAQVVRRRLERALSGDKRFLPFPDLILIDGGKGQLHAARQVMEELGLEQIPTVALAKEFEQLFIPGRPEPIVLPRSSPALQLLQRVRDEAHRFALLYHRTLRQKRTVHSLLDDIPGLGPRRKKLLIQHFGSVQKIREASLEELLEVPGLPDALAHRIRKALH